MVEVQRKARHLRKVRRALEHLAASCQRDERPDCQVPVTSRILMQVNDGKESLSKVRNMVSAVLRALAAASLILMPLGAAQAAGAAPGASAHADSVAGHCEEKGESGKAAEAGERHCASCMAVRAIDTPLLDEASPPRAPITASVANLLPGLELEIALPPPRQA